MRHILRYSIGIFFLMAWTTLGMGQDQLAADTAFNGALGLTNAGEYELARDGWAEFLEKYPTNSQRTYATHYWGVCLFHLQEYDAAREKFQTAAADPHFPARDEAVYFEGLTCFEKARTIPGRRVSRAKKKEADTLAEREQEPTADAKTLYAEAIQLFRQILSQFSESSYRTDCYFYCGLCFQQLGKYDDAIHSLKIVISTENHPLVNRALYTLAEVYLNLRKPDSGKALTTLDTLLKNKPDTATEVRALRLRADVLYQLKRYAEAAEVFAGILTNEAFSVWTNVETEDPTLLDLANLLYRYGETQLRLKKEEEARALFAKVCETYPNSSYTPFARYQMALAIKRLLVETGNTEKYSLQDGAQLWQAILDDPATRRERSLRTATVHQLSRYYLQQNEPQKSLELLDQVFIEKAPTLLIRDKADTLAALQRYGEAITLYERLFSQLQKPENESRAADAIYQVIRISSRQKDYAQALATAQRLASWNGFSRVSEKWQMAVRHEMASASYQLQQYREAQEIWQSLLEQFPDSPYGEIWVTWCAYAMQNEGNYRGAVTFLRPWVEKAKSLEWRHILGVCEVQAALALPEAEQKSALTRGRKTLFAAYRQFRQQPDYSRGDALYYDLANTYFLQDDYKKCDTLVKNALKRFKDSSMRDRFYYLRGKSMMQQEKNRSALQAWELLTKRCPKSPLVPEALLAASQCCLRLGKTKEAIGFTTRLEREFPENQLSETGANVRAVAAMETSDYDMALEAWQVLLHSEKADLKKLRPDALYGTGFCFLQQKNFADAEKMFAQLLEESPDWEYADRAYYQWIKALLNQKKQEEAERRLAEMEQTFPESAYLRETRYLLGLEHYAAEEMERCREYFAKVSDGNWTDRLSRQAALRMVWSFYRGKNAVSAARRAQETLDTIRITTDLPSAEKQAIRCFEAELQFVLGMSLFDNEQPDQALECLKRSLESGLLEKAYAENGTEIIVQIYENSRQWKETVEWARRFAEKFPESEGLPRILYKEALAAYMQNQLHAAEEVCHRILSLNDALFVSKALFLLGEIQFARKDHEGAIKTFYQVIYGLEEPTLQADALYETARCFEALGKKEQAIKHFNQLLERFPDSDKVRIAKRKLEKLP